MSTTNECPLARDINGDPIAIPPEVVAWRVRRRTGKQGRPQSVFDPETGTPLEIPLESDIDELQPYGPAGYRLDGIDVNGKMVSGVTAYVEVPPDESKARPAEEPSETAATLREVTQLLRESLQTQCRALEAMAGAFGPVRPAEQPQPVYMLPPQTTEKEEKPADLMEKIKEFMPMIQGFMMMMKGQGGEAAGAANAPAEATAPTDGAFRRPRGTFMSKARSTDEAPRDETRTRAIAVAPKIEGEVTRSLKAVLARDESAWRAFVAQYDPQLRTVVRHALEATDEPLTAGAVDDVLADFWLAVVSHDMRLLRAFNPERGAALLTWLTFHVAQIAYQRLQQLRDEPTFVPLREARNVAAPPVRETIEDAIRSAVRTAIADELRNASVFPSATPSLSAAPEYLSPEKAAAVAGVKSATIREWIAKEKIAGHRAGRLLRVRRDELERFLAGVRTGPGVEDIEARRRKALARLK